MELELQKKLERVVARSPAGRSVREEGAQRCRPGPRVASFPSWTRGSTACPSLPCSSIRPCDKIPPGEREEMGKCHCRDGRHGEATG